MKVYRRNEFNALLAGAQPPTDDDISITTDGRRLDSVEAVMEFVREVELDRIARLGAS